MASHGVEVVAESSVAAEGSGVGGKVQVVALGPSMESSRPVMRNPSYIDKMNSFFCWKD
jgi:hypothetical protein